MKKIWLISGAMVGCLAGAGVGACGSSNGTGASSSTSSSSTSGTTTTSSSSSSSGTTTTSSSSGAGGSTTASSSSGAGGSTTASSSSTTTTSSSSGAGGSECGKITTLHPPKLDAGPGTIYCPFSAVGDGGNEYCTPGTQHCCETPEGATTASACTSINTSCMTGTGYTDWQCEDPVTDCTAAGLPVCCAPGATLELGTPAGTCGNYASEMKSAACVAAGTCTGIILCTSNSECPAAHPTCTPFSKAGNDVGGCM
jgi:hypothetical protein